MDDKWTIVDGELYHFGTIGMKWGVRRYQNYDGSYTQAGMKRYNKSLKEYEHQSDRVREAKASGSRSDLANAKIAKRQAKRQLTKDYKHLKLDKMADKGKNLYSEGKTITGTGRTIAKTILGSVAAVSLKSLAQNPSAIKYDQDKQLMAAIGGVSVASLGIMEMNDKRIRAYYGHTSKY